MSSDRYLIYTTMKNEGPYMLEWVAYYLSLGADHFVIFTNDCDDGTDAIAQRLTEMGIATHVDNKVRKGGSPQNQMLRRIRKHPEFLRATWTLSLDVDEYLNIRLPDPSLRALTARLEKESGGPLDAVSFAWKLFGCAGVTAFMDAPVTEQFFLCDEEDGQYSGVARGFKSMTRNNGKFTRYGPHRAKGVAPELEKSVRWSDGGGRLKPYSEMGWRAGPGFRSDFARLHHYALRSLEAFLIKRDRGKTNHINADQAESYWNNMNANLVEDRSILEQSRRSAEIRNDFHRDPVLSRLHRHACAWHRARIEELYERDEWADFRAFLVANKLRRLA